MLRIVHVPGLESLKYGGFEHSMLAMAKECSARGHRFYCIWEKHPVSKEFNQDLSSMGAQAHVMPANGRSVRFLGEMARWLHRNQIDVLHAHFMPASILALAAARLVQVPLVVCSLRSGLTPDEIVHLPVRSAIITRIRQSLAARVFTVSGAVGQQYRNLRFGGRESKVHYNGVPIIQNTRSRDAMRRTMGLDDDEVVVACVAFHNPIKGVDILLRALRLLAPQFPRLRVIQIGSSTYPEDTSETETLHQLARDIGVASLVMWTGHRNDVHNILQCADIYCQPSRSEGLPLAVLEAMGASLPVVAARVGGIPEAVLHGQTGLLAEPESPESLAHALAKLLGDKALCRRFGQTGLQRVRNQFDLEQQTKRLVDTYEHMIRTIRS